jgi:hypothetical protein
MASSAVSGPAEYLARRRLRITLIVAAVEAFLVLVDVLPGWAVLVLAVVAVAFWAVAGRNYQSATVRQASWIFASSQLLAALVPLLLHFLEAVAWVVFALVAIVALVLLFSERHEDAV